MNLSTSDQHRPITQIEVEGLFGRFDYCIPSRLEEHGDISRLCVLYGDNGAGKTTILSLLFRLLSPTDSAGHKTYVAQTPFKRFAVRLSDGSQITAQRRAAEAGSYQVYIHEPERRDYVASVIADKGDYGVVDKHSPDLGNLLGRLRSLHLRLCMLSDGRRLTDEAIGQREKARLRAGRPTEDVEEYENEDGRASALRRSIQRAVAAIKDRLIDAAGEGEASVEAVYRDLSMRLTQSLISLENPGRIEEKTHFVGTLQQLHERSKTYSVLGLTPTVVSEDLIRHVQSADSAQYSKVYGALKPYADGISARLDALEDARALASSFVESINGFLHEKVATFRIQDGLTISLKGSGWPLDPEKLSSGERQLLVLLCNAIHVGQFGSTFLIDEPELSLNIKWQRRLIPALLRCTAKTPVQFILATHAIPMVASHLQNVTRLGAPDDSEELFDGKEQA